MEFVDRLGQLGARVVCTRATISNRRDHQLDGAASYPPVLGNAACQYI